MGKGDWKRPSGVPEGEYTENYKEAFGPPKPLSTVMSDADRQEFLAEKDKLALQEYIGKKVRMGSIVGTGMEVIDMGPRHTPRYMLQLYTGGRFPTGLLGLVDVLKGV